MTKRTFLFRKAPSAARAVVAWRFCLAGALAWIFMGTLAGHGAEAERGPRASQLADDDAQVQQEQYGWRPRDGAQAQFNPPSFIWPHEEGAVKGSKTKIPSYQVQWSAERDFGSAVTVTNLPFNTYTHNASFKPGTYYWRYGYLTTNGAASAWSRARRFTIAADAIEFPMPSRAEQKARIPAGHPRLFMRPEDLGRLRAAAQGAGEAAGFFGRIRKQADDLLTQAPTPEPKQWKPEWPGRLQTLKACLEAEILAFTYLISQEERYGEAARRRIALLAAWDLEGATSLEHSDEASLPMLHRLARAYDWAYAALRPEERQQVLRALAARGEQEWKGYQIGRGYGHLTFPYGSHANRAWHKLGEMAIGTYGEIPAAEMYLDYAVNKFFACYPVWNDEDGGWHEGLRYWNDYMCKAVWWLQVAQSALQINGFQKPYFAHVGDFPLYLAPPGSSNSGFGDLSYEPPRSGYGGYMNYYTRSVAACVPGGGNSGAWRWWTQAWGMPPEEDDKDAPSGGILAFLYAANLGPLPAARPPTNLPPSKVFRGVGVASLHATLLDSRDDVHFLIKASPYGRRSHGHEPQGTFQLNAYGEPLLLSNEFRDSEHSKFHINWVFQTRAHNAILVNGEGQLPPPLRARKDPPAPGQISDFKLSAGYDYVVADATEAYGGKLKRCERRVVFVKPDVVVLCDDVAAPAPATFQFMLHALKPFAIDPGAGRLTVEQPKAGVAVQYLSPVPLAFNQTEGYTPKPNKIPVLGECPNQWHVEAGTSQARAELQLLTVLVPYRAGHQAAWKAVRLETETAVGVQVERGGTVQVIGFRKHGKTGAASLGGLNFSGPVGVQP